MKKTIGIAIFMAIIFITNIVYGAGSVSLSASKSSVTVGEEFTVSVNLSRSIHRELNCQSKRRYLKSRLCFRP